MGDPGIDDMHLLDPRLECFQCSFNLGNHPCINNAVANQFAAASGCQVRLKCRRIFSIQENPRHVTQENQLFGLNQSCDGGSGCIGVDVQLGPDSSNATDGSTGITPSRQVISNKSRSISVTSPTRPRSIGSPFSTGSINFCPIRQFKV